VAAAFWLFLWGPVGLVLAGPLTVCLLILGKYVPQLEFLAVLLGDEPALESEVTFYQRLAARDEDEAADIALAEARETSPPEVADEVLVPALVAMKRDRHRDELTAADERFILDGVQEVLDDLDARVAESSDRAEETPAGDHPKVRLLGCAARDEADAVALRML